MELVKLTTIDLLSEHRVTNCAEHNANQVEHYQRLWIVLKVYTSR